MFSKHFIYFISSVFLFAVEQTEYQNVKLSFVCVCGGGGFESKFDYKNHIHAPRMTAPTNNCSYRHLVPHSMNVLSSRMPLMSNPSDGELNTTPFLHSTILN